MESTMTKAPLFRLNDTGLTPENPGDDVRGQKVLDTNGEEIGTVEDLLVNSETREVELLSVASGGFLGLGATTVLIPVGSVDRVDDSGVHLSDSREHVAGAPPYSPHLVEGPDWEGPYWPALYTYYGGWPYWR